MPSPLGFSVTYPNLARCPVFLVSPGMTPHILCILPSESSMPSCRYMNPPHSAMHGMPASTLALMSAIMDVLDSSASACSSGYPPERTMPSTSGSLPSFMGENSTISAPVLRRSSMLSS